MNIFYLDHDHTKCAEYHCDKHVVKMILEYSQLLSTAHRMLDGKEKTVQTDTGKRKRWILDDTEMESTLYLATHHNHPSAVWCRQSRENYQWLYGLLVALHDEFSYRYNKVHASSKLLPLLSCTPKNIKDTPFFEPTPAMPDHCKVPGDSLASYRLYYKLEKQHILGYTSRLEPDWLLVV